MARLGLAGEVAGKLGVRSLSASAPATTGARKAAPTSAKKLPPAEVRRAIIEGVKRGRKEWVSLRFGRRTVRGQVVAAGEKTITIRTRSGMQMSAPWSMLSQKQLAALAK